MDPLSIASGAAGLTGVCIKVTKWLYEVIEETRRADTTLTELCSEVNTLTGVLAALDSTIRGCTSQPQVLAYIDSDIWAKIDSQVTECRTTLGLLEMLLGRIHESRSRMFRRGNIQARLVYHSRDIKGYKDMVHTHYRAIQMALGTVNVALCVRTSTSQDRMFLELKELRKCVELALNTAREPGVAADPRLVQLAVNLQSMAKSVQSFHTAASTMASSVSGSSRWGGSVVGELPPVKRELIHEWQHSMASLHEESSNTDTNSDAIWSEQGDNSTTLTAPTPRPEEPPKTSDYDLELDYDSDLELEIHTNLHQLAKEYFHKKQYGDAEEFLQKLVSKFSKSITYSTSSVDAADMNLLQLRLASCHLAQGRWGPCSSVLLSVARDSALELRALPTLLHAVAVGFLSENSCTEAQRFCKLALQRKRKIWGKSSFEYAVTLALLVRIALTKGDTMEALALRRAMPPQYAQKESSDIVMNELVTGLGFLHWSNEYTEVIDHLWGQPASVQPEVLPPVGISTSAVEPGDTGKQPEERKKPEGAIGEATSKPSPRLTARGEEAGSRRRETKSKPVSLTAPLGRGHTSTGNNLTGDQQLLDPHSKPELLPNNRKRSITRSPRYSDPPASSFSCRTNNANLYDQPTSSRNISSPSFPPRGESETDTFKEYVSGLYLYVQSLDASTRPFLSEKVAILGYHGKLTCTRDWSVLGLESRVSSGGSTYSVHLDIKYDMLSMIVYARFLEHCDLARRKGPALVNNEGYVHVVEEIEAADDSLEQENPTDTYKEVCWSGPSFGDLYRDLMRRQAQTPAASTDSTRLGIPPPPHLSIISTGGGGGSYPLVPFKFSRGFRAGTGRDPLFRPGNPSPYGRLEEGNESHSRGHMPRSSRAGPSTFEEMGIKQSDNPEDCIIM